MPYETSKSVMRRLYDRRFATTYLVGEGIDVGAGPDPISQYKEQFPLMGNVKIWDVADGDGMLLETIQDESLDFVHSSHCLEHLKDPVIAMDNWIRVCKKGGHIVMLLPDEDLFEQGVWPSRYAGPDHISSWTIGKVESWSPVSNSLIDFLKNFVDRVEILKIELLNNTYRYQLSEMDQTRTPIAECAIEVILRKKTDKEIQDKGRLPSKQVFVYRT